MNTDRTATHAARLRLRLRPRPRPLSLLSHKQSRTHRSHSTNHMLRLRTCVHVVHSMIILSCSGVTGAYDWLLASLALSDVNGTFAFGCHSVVVFSGFSVPVSDDDDGDEAAKTHGRRPSGVQFQVEVVKQVEELEEVKWGSELTVGLGETLAKVGEADTAEYEGDDLSSRQRDPTHDLHVMSSSMRWLVPGRRAAGSWTHKDDDGKGGYVV